MSAGIVEAELMAGNRHRAAEVVVPGTVVGERPPAVVVRKEDIG